MVGVVVVVVVGGGAFGGCVDVSTPDGALINCGEDDVCPAPLVCEPTSRLCVRTLAGDELAPPTTSVAPALLGQPDIDAGTVVVVDVVFGSAPLRDPTVQLVADAAVVGDFAVAAADGDHHWTAQLAASAALPEGRLAVVVNAFDARGLPKRFAVGVVTVDVTPAVIGNVAFSRLPNPQKTPVAFELADDNDGPIGPNIDVSLSFSLSEPTSTTTPPLARLDGSTLPLVRDAAIENPVTFRLAWPADVSSDADGAFDVVVTVVDVAGNVSEAVVGNVVVDASAPGVDGAAGALVFERAPWGRAGASGRDVYTVVGDAGVVDSGDFVLVTRDPEGLREIGRTRADDDGFGGVARGFFLATGDVREVFVVVADDAGNVSAPVAVATQRWIASPGGKVVGDNIDNPHHFEELPIFTDTLQQSAAVERGDVDGVGAVDDEAVVTVGAGTFTAQASDDGDSLHPAGIGVLVGSALGNDPVRGFTVLFGGSQFFAEAEGPFRGLNARCVDAIDDLWVRRSDGRFRRLSLPAQAPRPPPMANAQFVFDTRRNTLVLVGRPTERRQTGAPQMWSFDGASFQQLCTDAACAASLPPALSNMGLAADPVRQVLVAHGGDLGAATFEFDGAVWKNACDAARGCAETSGGNGGLVYDERAGHVVWFDGAQLAAFDGVTWTPLCTDAACVASAPPPRLNTTAAYDRRRGKLVTFGGDDPSSQLECSVGSQTFPRDGVPDDFRAAPPFADTWEFDGATWTQATPTTVPPSRSLHEMVWDESAGAVFVVGGDDCACNQTVRDPGLRPEIEENAWAYDGVDWRRIDTAPAPPAGFTRRAPLAAAFHTLVPAPAALVGATPPGERPGVLAYGDSTGRLVLLKDGRFFDSGVDAGAATFLNPVAEADDGALFAYDGSGAPFAFRFEGFAITPVCTPDPTCGQGGGPTPTFFGFGLAHDGARLVSFGGARNLDLQFGSTFSATAVDDTFVFDAAGLRQTCGGGSCGPPRRTRTRLTATAHDGEVLLFGGSGGDSTTWLFGSDDVWRAQATTTTPPARQDLILTRDPARGAVVMTGGTDDDPGTDTRGASLTRALPAFLDDVYEWTSTQAGAGDWSLARVVDPEGDGRPSPRFAAAAASDGDVVVVHGGVPSPERLFSGPPGGSRLADVWTWNGGATLHPAQRFRVTTAAAGLRAGDAVTGAVVRWFAVDADGAAPELLVWNGASWASLEEVDCGAGCVEAALDEALARRAIVGPARELIVAARGPRNGLAPGYEQVRTDFVEVELLTRRE